MAAQLREPFFLRGRRSLLQRAVVMSLALSAISYLAGTTFSVCTLIFMNGPFYLHWSDVVPLIHAAVAAAVLVPVGSLYCFWSGSNRSGIAVRMLALVGILVIPSLSPQLANWFADGDRWLAEFTGGSAIALAWLSMLLSLIWAAWSLACFRLTRAWLLTSLLSLLTARLSMKWIFFLSPLLESLEARFAGLPGGDLLALGIGSALFGGQYFAALIIPWGIPFWCPQTTEGQRPAPT